MQNYSNEQIGQAIWLALPAQLMQRRFWKSHAANV
jgi:hypothetical protein